MNWGGVSFDPERGLMIVNAIYYGTIAQLVLLAETDRLRAISSVAHIYDLPQPQSGTPYGVRLSALVSPLNVPCNEPPFGTISAIDLRTRKLVWTRSIGSARDIGPVCIAERRKRRRGRKRGGGE